MPLEQYDPVKSLEDIKRAQAAAERNSVNNGVISIVWGILIIIGLTLFDIFPGSVATWIWVGIAVVATLWTTLYGKRLPVQPRKYRNPFIWWGFYYAVLLVGGILLFPSRPPFLFTGIGLLAALPLIILGVRQWRKSQER